MNGTWAQDHVKINIRKARTGVVNIELGQSMGLEGEELKLHTMTDLILQKKGGGGPVSSTKDNTSTVDWE